MKILIIFLLFLFWSCTSCNSDNSKPDTDAVQDKDSVTDTDIPDNIPDDSEDIDQLTDADTDSLCYPLLIDAPFPYYDKDGKITFCRPGCDAPTEKDPQCMSNLWKEQNQALCTQMPQYDCCGYPCVMESLKPLTKDELYKLVPEMENLVPMHKCDLYLSRWGIDGTMGVVKSWNMSDGKIGFHLYPENLDSEKWPVKRKYVTYNIATKQYSFIVPARGQEQAYYKGKRIGLTADKRSLDLNNTNIFMAYMSDDGKKELIYNKKVKQLSYEPALNDKWAFANISEPGSKKMAYAKVGEWKWTVLGEGLGWFPSLVGDKLSFTDDDVNGWICDLSKNPQKLTDCLKFNKEGEQTEYLFFDKENETRLVYYSTFEKKIVFAEKEGDSYKRTDLITEFSEASSKNAFSLLPRMLRGTILLYEEVTTDGNEYGGLLCYYRIDKNKKYCMKKMENDETYADGTTRFPYGYAEFEGKWLLYQKRSSTPLILRDMDCYCKEEEICPFEE